MNNQIKTACLMAALSVLIIFMGSALGGRSGVMVALVFAILTNAGAYWFSDKIVLSMYHAQEVGPQDAPMLYNMIQELSGRAGIPMPRVCIVPEQAPNAFATGRDPEHAVVAVTEGILRLIPPQQLKGVLAHEVAHIAHRDILISGIVSVMAAVVTSLAHFLQFAMIFGRRDNEDSGSGFAGLAMVILGPIAAALIQMAVSRSREYMADASGAEYCGDPRLLADALHNIEGYAQRITMQANPATENMFIISPFSAGSTLSRLFSTHPATEERVANLYEMYRTGRYPG